MARVFTIAPGLENMGGLKTGGQGSIYKGRRIGEIITAIKILPTPISNESNEDKNYVAFQNEVKKLKKVNEVPNPNVVKILSSGISEAGNFPFIEMEYIEGPDLEELMKPPASPIFTINESLKVAEQLSYALSHCHKLDVRHGDIKSNNVKYNVETGNYILLDFGLAMMSEDQRRSSVIHTGAIEFMAPEQNAGQIMFETDVYGFGIILFELLTGTVPFKLKDRGESARNEVRLAHMANPVPDLIKLRQEALPQSWNEQRKQSEMRVPQWVVAMVNKCLEKKPEKRFANGIELHSFIVQQIISRPDASIQLNQLSVRPLLKKDFIANQELLKKELLQIGDQLTKKEDEVARLKELLKQNEAGTGDGVNASTTAAKARSGAGVSRTTFTLLLILFVALGTFAMYPLIKKQLSTSKDAREEISNSTTNDINGERSREVSKGQNEQNSQSPGSAPVQSSNSLENRDSTTNNNIKDEEAKEAVKANGTPVDEKTVQQSVADEGAVTKPGGEAENNDTARNSTGQASDANNNAGVGEEQTSNKYLVVAKAYFYDAPNEESKRNEFISPAEKAVVKSLNERYGFIYVVITNPQGQVFKGWLRKKELKSYSNE